MPATEKCERCGAAIDPAATPLVFEDHVLCAKCHAIFRRPPPQFRGEPNMTPVYLVRDSKRTAFQMGFFFGLGMLALSLIVAFVWKCGENVGLWRWPGRCVCGACAPENMCMRDLLFVLLFG